MSQYSLLIKGSTLGALHTLLQVAISFLLTPFIISSLGDRLYGIWLVIAVFVGYYGLLDLGISGSVMRYLSRSIGADKREEVKNYTSSAFIILSCIGILVISISIVIAIFAPSVVANTEDIYLFRFIILLLGCTTGLTFPLRIFVGVLNSNLRFDLSRYIEIGEILLRSMLIVWLLMNGFGIIGIAIASCLAMFIDFLLKMLVAFQIDKFISIRFRYFDFIYAKKIFEYGIFNFMQDMANMLSTRIDPLIIAYFIDARSVTYYGVVLSLVLYFSQFFYSILGVLFPYYSQKEGESDLKGLISGFIFTSKLCLIISTFTSFMVILYSKQFLVRWLGDAFESSYPYAVILFLPMVFYFGYYSSGLLLNSIGKHRLLSGIELLQGVTHLLLCLALVKRYGTLGVAWGAAIPMLVFGGLIKPLCACKTVGLSFRRFLIETILIPVKCLIIILPIWAWLGQSVSNDYASIFNCLSIHLIVFCVLGFFVILPKTDMMKIRFLLIRN